MGLAFRGETRPRRVARERLKSRLRRVGVVKVCVLTAGGRPFSAACKALRGDQSIGSAPLAPSLRSLFPTDSSPNSSSVQPTPPCAVDCCLRRVPGTVLRVCSPCRPLTRSYAPRAVICHRGPPAGTSNRSLSSRAATIDLPPSSYTAPMDRRPRRPPRTSGCALPTMSRES